MRVAMAAEGRWEFQRNIGTGGFGLVKLFVNVVSIHYNTYSYSVFFTFCSLCVWSMRVGVCVISGMFLFFIHIHVLYIWYLCLKLYRCLCISTAY